MVSETSQMRKLRLNAGSLPPHTALMLLVEPLSCCIVVILCQVLKWGRGCVMAPKLSTSRGRREGLLCAAFSPWDGGGICIWSGSLLCFGTISREYPLDVRHQNVSRCDPWLLGQSCEGTTYRGVGLGSQGPGRGCTPLCAGTREPYLSSRFVRRGGERCFLAVSELSCLRSMGQNQPPLFQERGAEERSWGCDM